MFQRQWRPPSEGVDEWVRRFLGLFLLLGAIVGACMENKIVFVLSVSSAAVVAIGMLTAYLAD